MTLRIIGAGLPRTGTMSLKLALEELLGQPCYHMFEVFARSAHIAAWHDASRGRLPDWRSFFEGHGAAVDLPASAYWRELATVYPDALIILSVRQSPALWWDSVSQTLFTQSRPAALPGSPLAALAAMVTDLWRVRLGAPDLFDKDAMIAAYLRHNQAVREHAPRARFLEWQAADGWAPIADALGLPVPAKPFPHANSRAEFRVPEFDDIPASTP
jgi:hypothetical protein